MRLSREAIQRMVGDRVGSGGGGGGGSAISMDDIQGMGFATEQWANDNYVAIPYFSQLFTIHGKQTTTVDGEVTDEQDITFAPNTMPSRQETTEGGVTTVVETTITRIEALFDFNSVGGVSALGYNPGGGGGGGADLNALLDSINSSNIGDTEPTGDEVGKCLVYNGNGNWAWATPGSGSGGIENVSVASAGLLTGGSVSGSTLTLTTRAIQAADVPDLSATYLTRARGMMFDKTGSYIAARFYVASGYDDTRLAAATGNNYIEWYGGDDNGWMNHAMGHLILTNTTQQIWSDTSGTKKFSLPSSSGTLATEGWVSSQNYITSSALSGYATESWVYNQGFATQSWVNNQGFVKSSGVTSVGLSMPTGFSVSNSPVTTSGTISVSIASGYFIPTTTQRTNWNDAYSWGNHANAGYMLRTEGMRFTSYENYIAARFVLADGSTYDTTRAALAQGSGYIEWWSTGGFFNHQMGNVSITDGASDNTCYLQIGGGRIYWDNQSKSLYVVQADGSTAANFYATGGVSALGISTGGSPSVSELTVGTLKGVRYLQNASGAVSITSGNSYIYIGAGSGSNVYIADSSNTYFDTNGHLHLNGKRLYLDSTRYVYVSSGHLYFYNGSSSVQIA